MGIAAADFDRNSSMDLFVTNYSREHNALYRGLGNGVFMDEARATGVMDGAMPLVGWGGGFADFDTVGWEDLIVVNGHTAMNLQLTGEESDYEQPTLVYHNSEGRFVLLNNCVQNEAESIGSSRGLAMLDADGDLDVDVVFTNQDTQPGVFENTSEHVQGCAAVRLIGTAGNRDAIGATVTISTEPPVVRVVQGGGSYLSTNSSTLYLPITTDSDAQVTITWPGGMQSSIDGLTADATWVILEPQTPAAPARTHQLPLHASR
jgi:hypothetical protein